MKLEQAKEILKRAKEKNKIGTSYIIYGGDEKEREEVALFFSGILNCENENFCKECKTCKEIINKNYPDVRWIIPEKSILSINEVRQVKNDIFIKPYYGKDKIYIFKIDYIKEEAGNAFLKIFEEPPEYGKILILCRNLNFLLPTIISRGFKIRLDYKFPEKNSEREKVIQEFFEIFNLLLNKKFFEFFKKIDRIAKEKEREEVEIWIEDVLFFLRDLYLLKKNIPKEFLINRKIKIENFKNFGLDLLEKIWEIKYRMKYNINIKIALENLFFQIYSRSGGMADAPGSGPGEG